MKKLSIDKIVSTVIHQRKAKKLTQAELSKLPGINRGMIGHLENKDYIPSIEQLQSLAEVLDFDLVDFFVEDLPVKSTAPALTQQYNIAVTSSTAYTALSESVFIWG